MVVMVAGSAAASPSLLRTEDDTSYSGGGDDISLKKKGALLGEVLAQRFQLADDGPRIAARVKRPLPQQRQAKRKQNVHTNFE